MPLKEFPGGVVRLGGLGRDGRGRGVGAEGKISRSWHLYINSNLFYLLLIISSAVQTYNNLLFSSQGCHSFLAAGYNFGW